MGQVRHGSATTTHAVRAAIQRSQASLATLSRELGINPKTVAKWRKRATVEDLKTGYNVVDIKAAKERGIPVCNIPTYGTASVAQHAFALILELTVNAKLHSDAAEAHDAERFAFEFAERALVGLRFFRFFGFRHEREWEAKLGEKSRRG